VARQKNAETAGTFRHAVIILAVVCVVGMVTAGLFSVAVTASISRRLNKVCVGAAEHRGR
jgi:hypothetical protein